MSRFAWGPVAASCVMAGNAVAQPGAPTRNEERAGEARAAALRGDCEAVLAIATELAASDPAYYADVFVRDPVIDACGEGVGGRALPEPQAPPPAPPPERIEPLPDALPRPTMSDGTRGVFGALAGIGAGGVLGLASLMLVGTIAEKTQDCDDFCDEVILPALIGGQVGMGVGLALGNTLVGNHREGRGSFGASVGGALAGSAVSWIFALSQSTVDNGAWGVAFFTLPVAGSIIGYWSTHEHDASPIVPMPAPIGGAPGIVLGGRF